MTVKKLLRGVCRLLLLLILYVLQTDVFTHLTFRGVCPLLLPLAAVGFGIFDGGLTGGLWGLAAGVLCDISAGYACTFTILLTFVGFFTGFLAEFVLARGFPSFFAVSIGTLLLAVLTELLPLLLAQRAELSLLAVSGLIRIVYSLIFVLPVYWGVRGISRLRGRI